MNYSEKVQESVEFADLRNKIQSVLDYIGMETSELEDEREYAVKNNQPIYHQAINNNIKQNYLTTSTLLAIRDILTKKKKALSQAGKQNDNA